jgi:hypothetical protein
MTDDDELDELRHDHAIVPRADRLCYDLAAEGLTAEDIAMILRRAVRIHDARERSRAEIAAEPPNEREAYPGRRVLGRRSATFTMAARRHSPSYCTLAEVDFLEEDRCLQTSHHDFLA